MRKRAGKVEWWSTSFTHAMGKCWLFAVGKMSIFIHLYCNFNCLKMKNIIFEHELFPEHVLYTPPSFPIFLLILPLRPFLKHFKVFLQPYCLTRQSQELQNNVFPLLFTFFIFISSSPLFHFSHLINLWLSSNPFLLTQ